MSKNNNSSGILTAALTGFILGGVGAVYYIVSHDKKKQESIKNAIDNVQNVTTSKLDRIREQISKEAHDTEEELSDLRQSEQGLRVH